ncbi:MAG: NAD(P)-binding protein [Leptolyngbya sp. SIO4C1]|nr:NAD(P)-binding protein [Leptolyngbya sp. SIO4C1]
MRTTQPQVAVIGAGIAGLTAAGVLRRQGIAVTVYEAGKQIAGLASSFHDTDGFTYDFGAHFLTNRLAAAAGIGAYCRTVKHYGEAVYLGGKTYGYPFGLLQNPRYLVSGLASRLSSRDRTRRYSSAAEWFRASYGRTLANEVALPLLEAWSGAAASDLAASVGEKMHSSVFQTLSLKLASQVSGRAVGSGYSHEVPEHPSVWHVYPKGGLSRLCEALASEVKDAIQLESPVEAILVDNHRVAGIRVRGKEQPASAVISTAPCHILSRLVQGTERLAPLAQLRYRPMTFVNLRLEGRGLLKDTVVWLPEKQFPFFRLTETPLSMPWLAPAGKTLITVDFGCQVGDQIWTMPDEALGELCIEHLQPLIPDGRRRYLGCRVLRTPIAYPVFLNQYEETRRQLEQSTGVEGLYSIGRNGEFSHSLMEDVYWRTRQRAHQILSELPILSSPALVH